MPTQDFSHLSDSEVPNAFEEMFNRSNDLHNQYSRFVFDTLLKDLKDNQIPRDRAEKLLAEVAQSIEDAGKFFEWKTNHPADAETVIFKMAVEKNSLEEAADALPPLPGNIGHTSGRRYVPPPPPPWWRRLIPS